MTDVTVSQPLSGVAASQPPFKLVDITITQTESLYNAKISFINTTYSTTDASSYVFDYDNYNYTVRALSVPDVSKLPLLNLNPELQLYTAADGYYVINKGFYANDDSIKEHMRNAHNGLALFAEHKTSESGSVVIDRVEQISNSNEEFPVNLTNVTIIKIDTTPPLYDIEFTVIKDSTYTPIEGETYSLKVPKYIGSSLLEPLIDNISFDDLSQNSITARITIDTTQTALNDALNASWRGVALFSNIGGVERQISNKFYFLSISDYYPVYQYNTYRYTKIHVNNTYVSNATAVNLREGDSLNEHVNMNIPIGYTVFEVKGTDSALLPVYLHAGDVDYFYTPCSNILVTPPTDTLTCNPPSLVKAIPQNGSIVVSFFDSEYNAYTPVTDYEIVVKPGDMTYMLNYTDDVTRDPVNNRASVIVEGLNNNTDYTLTVRAVISNGTNTIKSDPSISVSSTPSNDIGYNYYNYFAMYYYGASNSIIFNNLKFINNMEIIRPIKYTIADVSDISILPLQPMFKIDPSSTTNMKTVLQTVRPAGTEWGIDVTDQSGNNLPSNITISGANNGADVKLLVFKTDKPIQFSGITFGGGVGNYAYFKIYAGLSLNGEIPSLFDELYEYGYSDKLGITEPIHNIKYNDGYVGSDTLNVSSIKLPKYVFLAELLKSYNVITNVPDFVLSLKNSIIDVTQPLLLSSISVNTTNLLSLQGTSKKTARTNLLNAIFSARTDANRLTLTREELGFSSTYIKKENVFVAKPKTTINLNSELSFTTSVYSSLDTVGDFNTYTYNNIEFTITNTGNDPVSGKDTFSITGDEKIYYTDDVLNNYNGLTIVFGSAEIANADIAMHNVSVNFQVEIDASGNLDIFGKQAPVVQNVIVAQRTLPVNALYDSSKRTSLIEFWEPSDNPDTIKVQLANTSNVDLSGIDLSGAYQVHSKLLAKGLEYVLCDAFDCSNASPFNSYNGKVEYTMQRDFGHVALGCFAHYLFGHVDATSAITNDVQFMQYMLSLSNESTSVIDGTAQDRYDAYTGFNDISDNIVEDWAVTGSPLNANLAKRLVSAIVSKGLNNDGLQVSEFNIVNKVDNTDATSLANIVAQVVGQDASRLMNEDNNERTINMHIPLRFIPGDVIYVNIKLAKPTIQVGSGQNVLRSDIEGKYNKDENYTLKITLG